MIPLHLRPSLAPKARLRHDAQSGRYMLLYPERGIALNRTGADIVQLCTGQATVREIVDLLTQRYAPVARQTVEGEVLAFLETLRARALLVE